MAKNKEKSIPNIKNFAVVIGAMKSGTTTLYQYLNQHPQVCHGVRKELNFFSNAARVKKGRDAYLALWPDFDPARHRIALDVSPGYTKAPAVKGVPQRIRSFADKGSDFRFIYIVRDPVDRIESHLAHNIAQERIAFDVGLDDDMMRHALAVSRYARQLDLFREGWGGDPDILLLDFNDLVRRPLDVAERCAAFLGLDPFAFRPLPPANVRKKQHRAQEFRLGPQARAELGKRLLPDILEFRDRYGFDVSAWKSAPEQTPDQTAGQTAEPAAAPAPTASAAPLPGSSAAAAAPEAMTEAGEKAKGGGKRRKKGAKRKKKLARAGAEAPARASGSARNAVPGGAPARIEDFVVVTGAMKSGTTALFRYLRQHPQVAASKKKELNFFLDARNLRKGAEGYFREWPGFDPARHRIGLEASPNYTKGETEAVARRMGRFGPNFRFVYIMRNPIDRIESHLAHNIARGRYDLAEAETMDPQAAIRASSYASQLDAFRAGFREGAGVDPQILLLDFEDLRRAPLELLARIAGDLGIDPGFRFTPIPPPTGRRKANRANEFQLSPERRAALAETLRPEVVALRDRYGFDVSGWNIA